MTSVTLPNREAAFIQPQKLTGYLLSETHEIGHSKAKLLRAFGFNDNNVALLQQELLKIAYTQDIQEIIQTPHGTKYVLDGKIQAPNGRSLHLRTVWIIDIDQTAPRFVTARPIKPDTKGTDNAES
jgi:fructose-specific component phosphotransferase system IIB-like protein